MKQLQPMTQKNRDYVRNIAAKRYMADPLSPVVTAFLDGWEHRDELIIHWIPESELPPGYPKDKMLPFAKLGDQKMFPPCDAIHWIEMGMR